MKISITVIFLIGISFLFSSQFAEGKITHNPEYGFWIEYPDQWYAENRILLIEPTPGMDSGGAILAVIHDGVSFWESFLSVTLINDDYVAKNFKEQEYLNRVIDDLRKACQETTIEVFGFECVEHSVLDSEITQINGMKAYKISERWTEIYPDGKNSTKYSSIANIVVEDDVWQIDSVSTEEGFSQYSDIIDEIIHSFKFVEGEEHTHERIPEWIKNNAEWWSQGLIDDSDFISGIEFMIQEGIIELPPTEKQQDVETSIPSWVRNNAEWWASGAISEDEFIGALQYLIQQGIISV